MRIFFLIAIYFLNINLIAQNHGEDITWKNAFKFGGPTAITAGWVYQKYDQVLDLGVKKYNNSFFGCDGPGWIFTNLHAGAEIWYNNKIVAAPKVGVGITAMILRFEINVIGYNKDFMVWRPAITPELGVSFPVLNWVSLTGGYNIYLNNSPIMQTQTIRVSLKANIPFYGNKRKQKDKEDA